MEKWCTALIPTRHESLSHIWWYLALCFAASEKIWDCFVYEAVRSGKRFIAECVTSRFNVEKELFWRWKKFENLKNVFIQNYSRLKFSSKNLQKKVEYAKFKNHVHSRLMQSELISTQIRTSALWQRLTWMGAKGHQWKQAEWIYRKIFTLDFTLRLSVEESRDIFVPFNALWFIKRTKSFSSLEKKFAFVISMSISESGFYQMGCRKCNLLEDGSKVTVEIILKPMSALFLGWG